MSLRATYRPIPVWPNPTPTRKRASFRAAWASTLQLLEDEIAYLAPPVRGYYSSEQANVVFGVGLEERDIRQDGLPRANARAHAHAGVEISFDTQRHGRLVYATDAFDDWQDNVRAIALGLKHLRTLDRYGIGRRGEQYAGWKALPMGGPDPEEGRRLVERHGGVTKALMATHPDHGGDPRDFAHVQAYRQREGV